MGSMACVTTRVFSPMPPWSTLDTSVNLRRATCLILARTERECLKDESTSSVRQATRFPRLCSHDTGCTRLWPLHWSKKLQQAPSRFSVQDRLRDQVADAQIPVPAQPARQDQGDERCRPGINMDHGLFDSAQLLSLEPG